METIEEKALAYDKALEKVRYLYKHLNNEGTVIYPFELENIFPELKEGEDERIRKAILVLVDAHAQGMYKEEMLAWLEKQGMQKQILANSAKTCKVEPVEWSEEDEKMLDNIYASLLCLQGDYKMKSNLDLVAEVDEEITWLKSLKERSIPQPKPAEWSEEDEEELNKIIAHFDWTGNNRFTKDDCEWAQYWLKSLRPQNHWKPSDEQMKVLLKYAEQNNSDGYVLTSLYNNLKKLKD